MSMGFAKSKDDPNLSYKVVEDVPVIILLYVDDLFLTGNEKQIMESKKKLAEKFEMKDLGLMHYFLGMEVWQSSEGIFLNQGKYVVEILKRLRMQSHGHTHVLQPKAVSLWLIRVSGCDSLQTDHWVIDVLIKIPDQTFVLLWTP